jgi:hypothetical protein
VSTLWGAPGGNGWKRWIAYVTLGILCHRLRGFLTRTSKHIFCALIGGLALLAFCTTLIATPWGIGLGADSLAYVGIARRLLNGLGVTYLTDVGGFSPVNHYPPLYPATLAGVALIGLDPLNAARWLNAFLFAGNVVLISLLVFTATSSFAATVIAGFLAFTSFPMVQIHSMAWSEPLFILFAFSGLFFLAAYLHRSKRWMLYASGLNIALSCLTRYAGVAFLATAALGIFSLNRHNRKKRVADTIILLTLASLPPMLWALRNYSLAGSAVNRVAGFHPPGVADLITALNSVCLWFFPAGVLAVPVWARAALLIGFVLLLLRFGKTAGFSQTPLFQLACVLVGGYGIFLLAARSFFDNAISFDTRILSPAYVAAMMVIVSIVTYWFKTKIFESQSPSRLIFYLLVILFSVVQTTAGVAWWRLSYIDGIGFAEPAWRNSELVRFVNNVKSSAVVFTNVPDILYMLTGRLTAMIPSKSDPKSGLPNKQYRIEIFAMKEQLRTTGGAVLYFHTEQRLWYLPSEAALQQDAGLRRCK